MVLPKSPVRRKLYSANRLLAFDDYCKTTPRARVFFVLARFCIPALIVMILLDLVPLQDPGEGWRGNTAYWIRSIGVVVIASMVLVQHQAVIPEIVFTSKQVVAIALSASAACTGSLVVIAELWKFPVPFTYTVGGIPIIAAINSLVVILLGTANRARLRKLFQFSGVLGVQNVLLMVYPAYNAIFNSLEGKLQLAFVLLLPVMKHSFKQFAGLADSEYDDMRTAFSASVDIFDVLYMTECMQSAGTLVAVKCYAELRENSSSDQESQDVLSWVADFLIKAENCDWLALRPRKTYIVSAQAQQALSRMHAMQTHNGVPSAAASGRGVVPIGNELGPNSRGLTGKAILESSNKEAVVETARLLHESEAVVVVEYIEAVVPVVYGIYIAILFHLPNAKYYKDMESFTEAKLQSVVTNIMVYALMELLSLLYVHHMVKHRFGVSVFYQLAFALESEWQTYQCEFVMWILVVFQFLLVHSGADFTFKFDWNIKRD